MSPDGAGVAFTRAAAWWDADVGAPQADLLPRAQRAEADFSTRILAHVLGALEPTAPQPLRQLPWVLGIDAQARVPGPQLRRILGPENGLGCIHAGPATVPMVLFEAIAHLVDHEAVLVAFAQDSTPPHHEALASAMILTRAPLADDVLGLRPPILHRTFSHCGRGVPIEHPFTPAVRLARAIDVGQPTIETTASCGMDLPERWRIELYRPF